MKCIRRQLPLPFVSVRNSHNYSKISQKINTLRINFRNKTLENAKKKKHSLWEHRIFECIYIKIFHAIRIACKPLKNDKSQNRNLITQQNIPKRCSHF